MPGTDIGGILAELSSNRIEGAWKVFLNAYSTIIMQVVCQYESNKDRADECFLFVCEKLSDDGFRRLLQFETNRKARFSTWLRLVVSNLCVDWHRKEFGRQRPYRAIAKLSKFDQLLYHYKIECGMNRQACFRTLQLTYPDLTENHFDKSLCRLHTTLTPKQRWQLSMRKRETSPALAIDNLGDNAEGIELAEPGPGPETVVQLFQTREKLAQAMSQLNGQQRLLLRLRYQEDLSLKAVAELAGLGDLHQAKRRIKRALAVLAELLDSDVSAN